MPDNFGWHLPPGCTERDISAAADAPEPEADDLNAEALLRAIGEYGVGAREQARLVLLEVLKELQQEVGPSEE